MALKSIVSVFTDSYWNTKKERKYQVCVCGLRVPRRVDAVRVCVRRRWWPSNLLSFADTCRIIWLVCNTIVSGRVWKSQNVKRSVHEKCLRRGWLDNDSGDGYDCEWSARLIAAGCLYIWIVYIGASYLRLMKSNMIGRLFYVVIDTCTCALPAMRTELFS